ncbi:MAG: HAD-IIIA family hydrolase [Candidatus Zixiibacteriota bacterium]
MQQNKYKILIIRLSSLGDIILTTPVLDALKENFKNSEIYFLTKRKYQGLFESDPRVSSVIYFEPGGKDKGLSGLFRLIRRLNQEKFDLMVDLHSNLRSFFIRHLVKARKKIWYHKRLIPRFLMVYFKKWKVKPVSTIDCYLEGLGKIGLKIYNRIPKLYSKNEEGLWADNYLLESGVKIDEVLIGIAPGAKWETKRWDKEKFSLVAKNLSQELSSKILLVGDKNDQMIIEDTKTCVGESNVIQAIDIPLNRLVALVERCELFISNDSGPMHLASASGVPTIGIFGPTHPGLGFSPEGLEDKIFFAGVECSPCSLHGEKECVKESRFCMSNIKPEEIIEEAKKMITASKVIFLDRDGTITVEKDFVFKIKEIEFIPGAKEALKILQELGYKLVITSNQSGVGRGIMTEKQVEEVNNFILGELEKEGIKVSGIYYCPHLKEENCHCRKPKTGLIEKALQNKYLKLKGSWVIGDKWSDVLLGKNINGQSILVLTGYGQGEKQKIESNLEIHPWQKHVFCVLRPDYVARNLLDAALWIKSQVSTKSTDSVLNSSKRSGPTS